MTVNPLPVSQITALGSTSFCFGDSVILQAATSPGYTFQWFESGNILPGENSFELIVTQSGEYQVLVTDSNSCESLSNTIEVEVFDNPEALFVADDVCDGSAVIFVNNSTIQTGALSFVWDFGDGNQSTDINPVYTYASTGVYTVTLTVVSDNGCEDIYTNQVEVFPQPTADFEVSNACAGAEVSFVNLSDSAGVNINYHWNFGDGNSSTSENPVHIYTVPGIYNITLTVESLDGCVDSIVKNIEIYPQPNASFTISSDICEGEQIQFNNTSSISIGVLNYMWDLGDGNVSISSNPIHSYDTAGVYEVTLIAYSNFGCVDTVQQSVIVYPTPTANFNFTSTCYGDTVNFTNLSSSTFGNLTYLWNFGDGNTSTDENPQHFYQTIGTFNVSLTVTGENGCLDTRTKSIQISNPPTANFIASSVCQGESVSFTNLSTVASGNLTYSWSFGDGNGSFDIDPTHTYGSSGTYEVTLTASTSFGCSHSISRVIKVHPLPIPDFDHEDVCLGETMNFTNLSMIDTGSITQFFWDFGDGNVSFQQNPTHLYWESGTYSVTLTVTSDKGCSNTISKQVAVHPEPIFRIVSDGDKEFCEGESVTLSVSNTANYTFEWNTGEITPLIAVTETGWYVVTVTNTFGCSNTDSVFIQVNPLPVVTLTPDTIISKGFSVQLEATGGENYFWTPSEFLNNPEIANPISTPDETITYVVEVIDSNNCVNTASVTITVLEDFVLEIPNLFTPNGDGYNDTWEIGNIFTYPSAEVIIFNRWGSEVYQSSAYQNDWDGTYNGSPLPDGTYYYVIRFDNSDRLYKGSISIMR
ncbi:MAG: PKD domain-containing protein [Chitinophagaceae bacterium]|nr:MAG: PKD domain-containing protein [Chitinophagaceae bacterium]